MKQNKLVIDILKQLSQAGILDNVLLIGSWCLAFYNDYFKDPEYRPMVKTRDIDFLLPSKPSFPKQLDIEELLSPLGFDIGFYGKGFMKLESDELILEFLIPEIGRHNEKPYPLKSLNFNAQPLRHLSMLWRNPVTVSISGISCRLPHPADYFMQKLIASSKRKKAAKREKDQQGVLYLIEALQKKNDYKEIKKAYEHLTKKEKVIVKQELESLKLTDVIAKI